MIFLDIPTPVTFPSGETVELFAENWEQVDYSGNQVPAGKYNIEGWMVESYNSSPIFGDPVTISIGTELEIGLISGGLFKIKSEIRNVGDYNALEVNWSITLDGGMILLNNETSDNIPCIPVGKLQSISSKFFIGFGWCKIIITAEALNAPKVSKTIDVFIFLFFIIFG